MITPEHPRLMARYNCWQNDSLMAAACNLDEEVRRTDRGAFFGSIDATFAHILWADRLWLSRLGTCEAPSAVTIAQSAAVLPWDEFEAARSQMDMSIMAWADGLTPADYEGDLTWFSAGVGREVTKPRWRLITHMFNHATHHRGQIHAMLTAAGQKPEDTDIPFMPAKYEEL